LNKHYNQNDCANNIFELHSSLFMPRENKSIAYLIGELFNSGMTLEKLSKEISYDIKDILSLVKESGNDCIFTLWIGGVEINESLITLDLAHTMFLTAINDDYDDAAIGAYLNK
jgi:dihydrofolate reductase